MKTRNTLLALLFFCIISISLTAQTLNPTPSISAAGTADTFKGGYTFSYATAGTPWNGSLISFGGFANQYDTQFSADYGQGKNISFRTKNGDLAGGAGIWNPWIQLATTNNLFSSVSSNEGGSLSLLNPLKTATNSANDWKLYNMTGQYGNSLQFWNYGVTGFVGGPKLTILDGGYVGIGTQTPANKLSISGSHTDTRFSLFSSGNGTSANQADLTIWASEPNLTYSGVGIGNNAINGASGITRVNAARGGSYIRMLDNAINFNTISNTGIDTQVMTMNGNGNVGIGTQTPENSEGWNRVFQIKGIDHSKILSSSNTVTSGIFSHETGYYGSPAGGILGTTSNHPFSIITNKTNRLVVSNVGNVGIGIAIPTAKLHINNGDNSYGTILANANESAFSLYTKTLSTSVVNQESFRLGLKYNTDENNGFISFYRGSSTSGGYLGFSTNGLERMRLEKNGYLGLGTNIPDEMLTVNGKIHAQEVRIDLQSPMTKVPDYVFANDYKLKTLNEVETYIKANSHLPEIPSAKEMAQTGMLVSEMNLSLLKKIEELTLYAIEQQKKMDLMAERLAKLEKK
jgi:hypothetical protein